MNDVHITWCNKLQLKLKLKTGSVSFLKNTVSDKKGDSMFLDKEG